MSSTTDQDNKDYTAVGKEIFKEYRAVVEELTFYSYVYHKNCQSLEEDNQRLREENERLLADAQKSLNVVTPTAVCDTSNRMTASKEKLKQAKNKSQTTEDLKTQSKTLQPLSNAQNNNNKKIPPVTAKSNNNANTCGKMDSEKIKKLAEQKTQARMIQASGEVKTYKKALIVQNLMEKGHERGLSVEAANTCHRLKKARRFMKKQPDQPPAVEVCRQVSRHTQTEPLDNNSRSTHSKKLSWSSQAKRIQAKIVDVFQFNLALIVIGYVILLFCYSSVIMTQAMCGY